MANPPAFDQQHPLWHEILARRKAGAKIEDLVALAHERGYRSLSYRQVNRALTAAKYVEHLPTRTAQWLQLRGEEIPDLDAWGWLRGLALVSSERLYGYQTAIAVETESYARKAVLAKLEGEERDRLTDLCTQIVAIEIKLGYRKPVPMAPDAQSRDINPDSMEARIGNLAAELVGLFSKGRVTVTRVTMDGAPAPAADESIAPPAVYSPRDELKLLGTTFAPGEDRGEDEELYTPPDIEDLA